VCGKNWTNTHTHTYTHTYAHTHTYLCLNIGFMGNSIQIFVKTV